MNLFSSFVRRGSFQTSGIFSRGLKRKNRNLYAFHLGSTPRLILSNEPPTRSLSILSSMQDSLTDRKDKQEQEKFREQVLKLANGKGALTITEWGAELDEAMSSWRMMIPGAKSQPEVEKLAIFRKIIAAMTPEEKERPFQMLQNSATLQRVASSSDTSADDVASMLQRFKMISTYQSWLRKRKEDGKRIPTNQEELRDLAQHDMQKAQMKKVRARHRRF